MKNCKDLSRTLYKIKGTSRTGSIFYHNLSLFFRFSYDDSFFHDLLHKLNTMFKGGGLLTMANFIPRFLVRIVKKSVRYFKSTLKISMIFFFFFFFFFPYQEGIILL